MDCVRKAGEWSGSPWMTAINCGGVSHGRLERVACLLTYGKRCTLRRGGQVAPNGVVAQHVLRHRRPRTVLCKDPSILLESVRSRECLAVLVTAITQEEDEEDEDENKGEDKEK